MGRYATSTSISVLMPFALSGNTTTSDSNGTDIWSAASDRAEGEVNSYLVARYDPSNWTTTGNPGVPPLVRKLTEDLACLFFMRSAMVQDSQIKNPNIPEWEKAETKLEKIRDGVTVLAYTDGSLVPTKSGSRIVSSTVGYSHIFGMDSERTWGVGTGQIDAIQDERDTGNS